MEEYNREIAIRKATDIINENFTEDDYFLTLTYERDNRPDEETAKKHQRQFVAALRKEYREAGVELKFFKCPPVMGPRGAVHHHVVINSGVKERKISRLWKEIVGAKTNARPPSFSALYEGGEYSALAAYMLRQFEDEDPSKRIRKYSCSRNLKRPKEEVRTIEKISWKEPPTPWRGYIIDKDSIRADCNPVNGRPYLFYRMVKIQPNLRVKNDEGKRITGEEAAKYLREKNKAWIKKHWADVTPAGEIVFRKGVRQDE